MSGSANTEREIMKLLKEGPVSVSQLAKQLNVRRDFLAGYLESLKDRGKLKMVKVGKANVYLITERKSHE